MELNPYTSPQPPEAVPAQRRPLPDAGQFGTFAPYLYVHPVLRTRIAVALLGLQAIIAAMEIGCLAMVVGGTRVADPGGLNVLRWVSLANGLNYYLAGIAFIVWLYRTAKNVDALGARGFAFTPAWAIFGWLIPIANLYIPYVFMSEYWKAAEPDDFIRSKWKVHGDARLVSFWWIIFLLTQSTSVAGLFGGVFFLYLSQLLEIGGCVLTVIVVVKLTARTEALYQQLLQEPEAESRPSTSPV